MATSPVAISQANFLRAGGWYQLPMAMLREKGLLPEEGTTPHYEYPKMIRLSKGFQTINHSTPTCDGIGHNLTWTEEREIFEDIVVNSEDEEERVLSGGKTSAQIEEDRQGLLVRCANMNIPADPSWSAVRLRRLLGDALDAPVTDEMGALKAKLAHLQEIAALKAQIAALEVQVNEKPEATGDIDELRAELHSLGIEVDMRWSAKTLKAKLDQASPQERAA